MVRVGVRGMVEQSKEKGVSRRERIVMGLLKRCWRGGVQYKPGLALGGPAPDLPIRARRKALVHEDGVEL